MVTSEAAVPLRENPAGAGHSLKSGRRPRVVIVGAGFGGLSCAKALRRAPVDILLLDRRNHHCFQPLLYQVATAALAPNDVAWPIRTILRDQKNVTTLLAPLEHVDLESRTVSCGDGSYGFDYLVLATGARHSYFGHEEWAPFAPGLKTIADATAIRRRILLAFERAELTDDPAERDAAMTFVVVGGGPTGVELAGAIAEIARYALPHEFRRIDPREARIIIVEAGGGILSAYPADLAAYAMRALERKGVETRLNCPVTACDARGVDTANGRIPAHTVIWAAGVQASPVARWLGAEHDRAGRVKVEPDLSVQDQPNVFVIGDAAAVSSEDGPVPGIAPAAKQMGKFVGKLIAARASGDQAKAVFRYRHAGDLATIGRNAAVVRFGKLKLRGFIGWSFWSVAHIYYLIGARNRIAVAFNWLWDYLTFQRGVRLIVPPEPAAPVAQPDERA